MKKLLIICPVYNEEEAIRSVTTEWIEVFEQFNIDYKFLFINDGSTDKTFEIIQGLKLSFPKVDVINKLNSGHGQTCIEGYKIALKEDYEWVFQIDSDGQCDPIYFKQFWDLKDQNEIIFGHRVTREDGFFRVVVSIFLKLTTFIALRQWVTDANVPYRLIKTSKLTNILELVPKSLGLANMFLSVLLNYRHEIKWVQINFRARSGGTPKVKPMGFVKHGITLYKDLRQLKYLFKY